MQTVCILGPDGSGKSTVIPHLVRFLESEGFNVATTRTTTEVPGEPMSAAWRKLLVSEDTTTAERFNAAISLYNANLNFCFERFRVPVSNQINAKYFYRPSAQFMLEEVIDYLIIERGYSSFISYNPLHGVDQKTLVPFVDAAVYLTSPFDILTERIKARGNSTDFQDINIDYRRKVYERGESDFREVAKHFGPGHRAEVFDNSEEHFSETARRIGAWLIAPKI